MRKCQKEILSLSNKDHRYLKLAMNLAMSSDCNFKHGAVIVKGGRVISTGINRFKNHPKAVSPEHIKQYCSVHAEVDAIRKLKSARGATIYVARIGKRGNRALSRPCPNCYAAIKSAGIAKIVYTN